ncbi:MAG: plasmid pRiA4b ORF-3 family protein [Chloroflexota bacterium]|nr:plasmid pRiA4b ORF-3 family protein [Chloroflexota bacterium]
MFWYQQKEPEFTPKQERILKETEIDKKSPGPILHDFNALLTYVSERNLRVTGKHQLPLKALPEINQRLAQPIEHGLQRPQQKSYPPIHGLYLLVRASGLTYVDETGSKPFLRIDDESYQAWRNLNPTEQYGALLESWLLRGNPEIVGERSSRFDLVPNNFERSLSFLIRIGNDGSQITGDKDAEYRITYTPAWHNLGLLMLFGCITIQQGFPKEGEGWQIEHVDKTPFGQALFDLLYKDFFSDFDQILALDGEEPLPFGVFQPILKPYFPKWVNNPSISEWTFREGVHVFKASLGKYQCRIALPAEATLYSLATMILNTISFDHDHLYQFAYQDRSGTQKHLNHPYMSEGPWADEDHLGDLPIHIGQSLTFLYDFGDSWKISVTLEEVNTDMELDEPVVLASHGKPPEQYPEWDDEW